MINYRTREVCTVFKKKCRYQIQWVKKEKKRPATTMSNICESCGGSKSRGEVKERSVFGVCWLFRGHMTRLSNERTFNDNEQTTFTGYRVFWVSTLLFNSYPWMTAMQIDRPQETCGLLILCTPPCLNVICMYMKYIQVHINWEVKYTNCRVHNSIFYLGEVCQLHANSLKI